MLWHVSCCIWLMVVLVISSDLSLTKETENDVSLNKPKFRFNEVADFADVVEPTEEEPKQVDRAKKNAEEEEKEEEFVRNERDQEDDTSTLRLALEVNGDSSANNKLFDLSLEGKEDLNVNTQHRRSIPRKYTNLLDLKYYYSKGLPIRGHLAGTVQNNQKTGKRKREIQGNYDSMGRRNLRKKRQLDSEANYKFIPKRNPVNIIPMMAETNPYMSNLADATNDAYLKMRNYAATLMLILTTPNSQIVPTEQKHIYEYHPAVTNPTPIDNKNTLKQRVKKCPDQVSTIPIKFVTPNEVTPFKDNNPSTFPSLAPSSPVSYFSQVPYSFISSSANKNFIPTRIISLPQHIMTSETKERKPTTISPLAWEADLLKDANIKLRREIPGRVSLAKNDNEDDTGPLAPIAHTSENTTSHLEISNKILTPVAAEPTSLPCVLNKPKDPEEEGCDDNDDDDEDCSDQNVNGTCHLTSAGKPMPTQGQRKGGRDAPNPASEPQQQEQGESAGGDEAGVVQCKQFWTLPAAEIQRGVTEAVQNIVAPEKQLKDIKPYKTGTVHESDSPCVKQLIPKVQNVFDFPTMAMNLNSMVSKISKCMKSGTQSGEENTATATESIANKHSKKGGAGGRTTTANATSHHARSLETKAKRQTVIKTEEVTTDLIATKATVLESNYDDSADYSNAQLKRLQRDLFVVTQLEQLLEKLTGENKVRNFREDQNSQYDDSDNDDINNDEIKNDNRVLINPSDTKNIQKRYLFKKKKRKKKKAKNVWKHIFGVRSDENRFLNQNFPNSQYAKYPI